MPVLDRPICCVRFLDSTCYRPWCADSSNANCCCFDVTLMNNGNCVITGFTLQLEGHLCGTPQCSCGVYFCTNSSPTGCDNTTANWTVCNSVIDCLGYCPADQSRSWCGGKLAMPYPDPSNPGHFIIPTVTV